MQPRSGSDPFMSVATAARRRFQNRVQLRGKEGRVDGTALGPDRGSDHCPNPQFCKKTHFSNSPGALALGSTFGIGRGSGRRAQDTKIADFSFWNASAACGLTFVSVRYKLLRSGSRAKDFSPASPIAVYDRSRFARLGMDARISGAPSSSLVQFHKLSRSSCGRPTSTLIPAEVSFAPLTY